jgi:hypothetical protein
MQRTTDEDMNRARVATQATGTVHLSREIVEFMESGVSITVGVVGADGRAKTGRAMSARVFDGSVIRLSYAAEGNAALAATARSGGPIAVTFSAPMSHRTIQIKGYSCTTAEVEPDDHANAIRQSEAFAGVLSALGYPQGFATAVSDYRSSTLCVLCFTAQAAFEQTPGPGAGRSI